MRIPWLDDIPPNLAVTYYYDKKGNSSNRRYESVNSEELPLYELKVVGTGLRKRKRANQEKDHMTEGRYFQNSALRRQAKWETPVGDDTTAMIVMEDTNGENVDSNLEVVSSKNKPWSVAQWNSHLYSNPQDVDGWLEFIQLQEILFPELQGPGRGSKKLAIVKKALQSNPDSPELLQCYIALIQEYCEPSVVLAIFERLKRRGKKSLALCFAPLLQYRLSHGSIFVLEDVHSVVMEIFDSWSVNSEDMLPEWIEALSVLSHLWWSLGYSERALGIYQYILHQFITSFSIEQEAPMVEKGEVLSSLPVCRERYLDGLRWRPAASSSFSEFSDPFQIVLPEDFVPFCPAFMMKALQNNPVALQDLIRHFFRVQGIHLPQLRREEQENWFVHMIDPVDYDCGWRVDTMPLCYRLLHGNGRVPPTECVAWAQELLESVQQYWQAQSQLPQLYECICWKLQLSLMHGLSLASVKKQCKSFLQQYPFALLLWRYFAWLECWGGHHEKAKTFLASTLQQIPRFPPPARAEVPLLLCDCWRIEWRTASWDSMQLELRSILLDIPWMGQIYERKNAPNVPPGLLEAVKAATESARDEASGLYASWCMCLLALQCFVIRPSSSSNSNSNSARSMALEIATFCRERLGRGGGGGEHLAVLWVDLCYHQMSLSPLLFSHKDFKQALETSLLLYPSNQALLTLAVKVARQSGLLWTRSLLASCCEASSARFLSPPLTLPRPLSQSHGSNTQAMQPWMAAFMLERDQGQPYRWQMLCEEGARQRVCQGAPQFWFFYLRQLMSACQWSQALKVFYRAIAHIPWCKELWLVAVGELQPQLAAAEAALLQQLLEETQIRLRGDFYNHQDD